MNKSIATVAVEKTFFSIESDFDYIIPDDLIKEVKIGSMVKVPFGNANELRSGIVVNSNATVVIYVPTNVTLTATGANGSGQTGGGAGICVPSSATLVITGEGEVVATGGNAGNGTSGANGNKGTEP